MRAKPKSPVNRVNEPRKPAFDAVKAAAALAADFPRHLAEKHAAEDAEVLKNGLKPVLDLE